MQQNDGPKFELDEEGDPLFDFFLEEGEDPIGRLGYGVVSYFSLIYTMMVIFALITAFFIPVMMNNMAWDGYKGQPGIGVPTLTTIGNLGQSETRCSTFKFITDKINIGCMAGTITEVNSFGVFGRNSEAELMGLCNSEKSGVDTGLACHDLSSKDHSFYTEKLAKCKGLQSCMINGLHSYIPLGAQSDTPGCSIEKSSSLYIQYTCQVGAEELEQKRTEALLAGCVTVFSCLVLLAVI